MDYLTQIPLTANFVKAVPTLVGSATTLSATAAPVCSIRGKFTVSLGIMSTTASPTTDATTGAAFVAVLSNYAAAVVLGVNAAGSLKACQGPTTPTDTGVTTTVGAFRLAPLWPSIPDDFCPFAYFLVRVAPSGTSFTLSTDNWDKSGVTCSAVVDIATLPARPQVS